MDTNYRYTVVPVGEEYAVRADHRGYLVAFRTTEKAAQMVANDLQHKANNRFGAARK